MLCRIEQVFVKILSKEKVPLLILNIQMCDPHTQSICKYQAKPKFVIKVASFKYRLCQANKKLWLHFNQKKRITIHIVLSQCTCAFKPARNTHAQKIWYAQLVLCGQSNLIGQKYKTKTVSSDI